MVTGSPPWNPQPTLAEVMYGITASSLPTLKFPKLSPMSQLMSIFRKRETNCKRAEFLI
jgi:hypothetical protein